MPLPSMPVLTGSSHNSGYTPSALRAASHAGAHLPPLVRGAAVRDEEEVEGEQQGARQQDAEVEHARDQRAQLHHLRAALEREERVRVLSQLLHLRCVRVCSLREQQHLGHGGGDHPGGAQHAVEEREQHAAFGLAAVVGAVGLVGERLAAEAGRGVLLLALERLQEVGVRVQVAPPVGAQPRWDVSGGREHGAQDRDGREAEEDLVDEEEEPAEHRL
eukprot:scaffold102817_cov63-Phaeocystis_antarctica.AAC.2